MLEAAGCCPSHCHGILTGYNRQSVKREVYPALIPKGKGMVEGVLYENVPSEAWNRLDLFEGEMYLRQSVLIRLSDESFVPAETYVLRPEYLNRLEEREWNADYFQCHNKNRFQKELGDMVDVISTSIKDQPICQT